MILYSAADLLWSTRIRSTAEAMAVSVRPVRSVEMLEARLGDSDVRGLVVDLDAPQVAMDLINRLRSPAATPKERSVRIVAWGPHVAVTELQAAKAAGADAVMARGAFSRRLGEILRDLDGGTQVQDELED